MITNYSNFIKLNESKTDTIDLSIENNLSRLLGSSDSKLANSILKIPLHFKNSDLKDNYANFLEFDETTGMITYMPNNKAENTTHGFNEVKYRSPIKPTKLLPKIFKDPKKFNEFYNITQRDVEIFSNLLKPDKEHKIEVWEGEKLLEAFNYKNTIDRNFSRSCANFYQKELYKGSGWVEPEKSWYDVYVKNPENIKVVVVLDKENVIKGRRLLLTGEQVEDQGTFKKGKKYTILSMYYGVGGNGSKYDSMLTKWAKSKGYYTMSNRPNGFFMFKIKEWKFPKFPPFDSCYINLLEGIISVGNYPFNDGRRWQSCYKLIQNKY